MNNHDHQEHLFRDDNGAAVEKAARLEVENAKLRQEIRELQAAARKPKTSPTTTARVTPWRGVGMAALGTAFMVVTIIARTRAHIPHHHHHSRELAAPIPVTVQTAAPTSSSTRSDCDTPFWFDATGVKHYKPQCIKPTTSPEHI